MEIMQGNIQEYQARIKPRQILNKAEAEQTNSDYSIGFSAKKQDAITTLNQKWHKAIIIIMVISLIIMITIALCFYFK